MKEREKDGEREKEMVRGVVSSRRRREEDEKMMKHARSSPLATSPSSILNEHRLRIKEEIASSTANQTKFIALQAIRGQSVPSLQSLTSSTRSS